MIDGLSEDERVFQDWHHVSRETIDRLRVYAHLLTKWNLSVNLVSRTTVGALWKRHFLDSAAIYRVRPTGPAHWLDIGSGGGFPGMVLAILDAATPSRSRFTLVEANQRKCAFLRQVAHATGIDVAVCNMRVEEAAPQSADIVTARGCAPLPRLLDWSSRHLAPGGRCLFLKGAKCREEIIAAKVAWRFGYDIDRVNGASTVLTIRNLTRG